MCAFSTRTVSWCPIRDAKMKSHIYVCTFIHVWYIDWFVIILISSNIITCSYFLHNLNLQPTKKFHLDACKSIRQSSSCASWCAFYRSRRVFPWTGETEKRRKERWKPMCVCLPAKPWGFLLGAPCYCTCSNVPAIQSSGPENDGLEDDFPFQLGDV